MNLTGSFKVVEVLKKTQAVFFKQLKAGDEFDLSYDLNGGYKMAPQIKIIQNGVVVHKNDGVQLLSNLDKFKIEQIVRTNDQ